MNIKESIQNYIRILHIAKKADSEEFWDTVRICGVGIGIVGLIGFVFYLISVMAPFVFGGV